MSRGLRLFSKRLEPGERRVYAAVAWLYMAITAGLVLPGNPLLTSSTPRVLGMPLSLAYIAAMVGASFAVLLLLFVWEGRQTGARAGNPREQN